MTTMNVAADPAYLAMPDAVNVNLLPVGYPAYLGYGDGNFRTANALRIMFPGAQLVILTVDGSTDAHGARVKPGDDIEPGDLTAAAGVAWANRALTADPSSRPVLYASVKGVPGYGMPDVLAGLDAFRIRRDEVRLLSAHYGLGPHVCGPDSCKAISTGMDGTQWTDSYRVEGGVVDMSLLRPDFFSTAQPVSTETERIVRELGIVRQGDTGEAVKTVQALLSVRLQGQIAPMAIDGIFGPRTLGLVKILQGDAKLTEDGVVGPLTWPVLLGVA